jgi:hypothetical protein
LPPIQRKGLRPPHGTGDGRDDALSLVAGWTRSPRHVPLVILRGHLRHALIRNSIAKLTHTHTILFSHHTIERERFFALGVKIIVLCSVFLILLGGLTNSTKYHIKNEIIGRAITHSPSQVDEAVTRTQSCHPMTTCYCLANY